MKDRTLKIQDVRDHYKAPSKPALLLKGKWLADAGFPANAHVVVRCEVGKLILTVEEPCHPI